MTAGDLYTVAGGGSTLGDNGPATSASLSPMGVAVDSAGNILVADENDNRIRVVAASTGTFYGQTMTVGDIYTIAGTGTAGFSGDGGAATAAELEDPIGVAVDSSGNVFVADLFNSRVRQIAAYGVQTLTITSGAPTDAQFAGATYMLTASGGASGNPVAFSSQTSSVCTVSTTTVSFVGVGTCTIDANQAGNANFNSAAQVSQSFLVSPAGQTINFTTAPPSDATYGGPASTVSATGGGSGNPVTLSIDGSAENVCSLGSDGQTVSFIGVGTCQIDANQEGSTDYAAGAAAQTFSVGQASQSVLFTSTAPTDATSGGPPYVVGASGGASGIPVVFTIDPSASAVCTLGVDGVTVSFLGAGTCTIDANQAGNADYSAASQATQSFTVHAGAPTITGFSPASAARGSKVKIEGNNLQGATSVTIGSVSAKIKSDTSIQIVIKVPTLARSGKIKVKTPAGSAKSATSLKVK